MNNNLPPGCTQADIDRRYRDPEDQHADAVVVCAETCEHWFQFLSQAEAFLAQRKMIASEGDLWGIMQAFEGILYSETSDARKRLEEAGFEVSYLPSSTDRDRAIAASVNHLLETRPA
jgi:hypothetical protein